MKTRYALPIAALLALAPFAHADDDIFNKGQRLRQGFWIHYTVTVDPEESNLNVELVPVTGNPDVYVRRGSQPTLTDWDVRPYNKTGPETVNINDASAPRLANAVYHVSVHARTQSAFTLRIRTTRNASIRTGVGAIPYDIGTTFRTWAPFASSVSVAGNFNGWNSVDAQMVPEGNGWYSLDVRGATPGNQYKFVVRNGTQTLWRNDPRARVLTNSNGNSIIYNPSAFQWTSSGFSTPAWNSTVIYQMHIGTFNDLPGGTPGTFMSAIQRLDYLQDLGINTVQLLPIHEFPGDYSWGYNPSYPFSVEQAYGGPDNLKRFIDEAHKRGIAVILDVVHNHYGPTDLDMWRFDGWSQGTYGGIFFYNDNRAITPWGDTRPDFGRPEVRQYIRDNAMMWLNEFRIDGFRWDSTLNMRRTNAGDNPDGWSLMQWINNEIDATQPWKIQIAEDMQGNEWVSKPTAQGGAGFDSQWTPDFVHPMRWVMTTPSDANRNIWDVVNSITNRYNGNALQRIIYTESHDEVANGRSRVPQEIDPNNPASYWARKRSTLGAVTTLTSPGIPMIFQGQEFLEDGWFQDTDPLDWNKTNVHAGIRTLYRDLIRLRRNWFNNTRGLRGQNVNVFHVNNSAKVIAYHRWDQGGVGDDVVVLMNWSNTAFNNYTIGLPQGGRWKVAFNSDWNGYGSDFDNTFAADINAANTPRDGLNFSGGFNLGRYSALILVRE